MSVRPGRTEVVVFAAAGIAWAGALDVGFLTDDFEWVSRATTGQLDGVFAQVIGPSWRPAYLLSFVLDARLWGTWAPGYHLTNLVLHALNAVLVLWTASAIGLPRVAAFTAAGWFALDPSHVGAVAWISGRSDVLATTGVLCSLLALLRFASGGGAAWVLAAVGALAAALLAKETAAAGAGWAMAAAVALGGRRLARGSLALLAVVALYVGARTTLFGDLATYVDYLAPDPVGLALSVGAAVGRTAWPLSSGVAALPVVRVLAAAALIGFGFVGVRRAAVDGRRIALLLSWLALGWGAVMPMLAGLPTLYDSRHVYLASVPIALLVGVAASGWHEAQPRAAWRLAAAAGLAALVLLSLNVGHWRRNGRLARAIVAQVATACRDLGSGQLLAVGAYPDMEGGYFLFHGDAVGAAVHVLQPGACTAAIRCEAAFGCPAAVEADAHLRVRVEGWRVVESELRQPTRSSTSQVPPGR